MIDFNRFLPVAVRAWTIPTKTPRRKRRSSRPADSPPINHILVVDTETTIDSTQALLFGAF